VRAESPAWPRLTWLFDLDNTLHNASPHIFPHINRSMTDYLARALGLGADEAGRVRRDYWLRYGATLTGMMRNHATDPHHFLAQTHDFPDLPGMLVWEPGLRAMLKRLPGRKLVFSNAPRKYAEAVLRLTGIAGEFDGVYAIERLKFRPKPAISTYRDLLRRERLTASRCIMVEDTLDNLLPARRLGLRTVWVSRSPRTPPHVDVRIASVLELPRVLNRLTARLTAR
jgi:putative hydrolase of the HAD superfamily